MGFELNIVRIDEHPSGCPVLSEKFIEIPGAHAGEVSAQVDVKIAGAPAGTDLKFPIQWQPPDDVSLDSVRPSESPAWMLLFGGAAKAGRS